MFRATASHVGANNMLL